MDNYVEVGNVNELDDGNMMMIEIEGREILVARIGEKFYSADNKCPHMGGNLSNGELDGTVVTCPRHHSQFDITDGHVIRWTDWKGLKLTAGKIFRIPTPTQNPRC